MTRRIHPTRFAQVHLRSKEGQGVPLVLMSPRSGAMGDLLQERLARPTFVHTGSIEAIEVAHQIGSLVRRVIAVGMPLFSAEEQPRRFVEHLLAANPGFVNRHLPP